MTWTTFQRKRFSQVKWASITFRVFPVKSADKSFKAFVHIVFKLNAALTGALQKIVDRLIINKLTLFLVWIWGKSGIKGLKTDKDVKDFLRGNVNETPFESSDEYDSSDEVEEIDYVDFHTKGKENIVIKNLSTQDPFLNKLCSNHGSFSGFIDELQLVDQEPIDDPDAASMDPLYKVKRGVSYPKHDPTIPWNEMQPVLGVLECIATKTCTKKKLFADDLPRSENKSNTPKKSMTCKKAKPKKKQGPPVKMGRPVKKVIPVKKSVCFSPTITKRSVNSGEGCSKHREGTSRDVEKSPQSPKWTKRRDFNRWSKRHKPIITMLEDIRAYLMQRVLAMYNIAVNLEDQISPTVIKKLEYLKREQRGSRGAIGGRNGSGRGARGGSANRGQQSTELQVGDAYVAASAQDIHEGDADVAISAQDKNKGKAIQEGSNSKSAAKPMRKSKRLRQEEPQPFRIYVKNRGRSERIAKLQGKNFKFDAQGTGSTPNKAFDVSESK
nr:splicing factor [Tanacetum cinerariifolium]